MNYLQFQKNLNSTMFDIAIKKQYQIGTHIVKETEDKFLLDFQEFNTIQETLEYINNKKFSNVLLDSIEPISNKTLYSLLKEHYPQNKITNNTINSLRNLIENKTFSFNTILESIRNHPNFSDKIYFILEDQSKVCINKNTYQKLNEIFKDQIEIEQYMKESKENFIRVIKQLGVQYG